MYISPDDAKTDVILAAAATIFGVAARGFVEALPLYPRQGLVGAVLSLLWVVVLTALVPVLLARYRQDGVAAFGLGASDGGWRSGLVLTVPVIVLGITLQSIGTGTLGGSVLGRLAGALQPIGAVDLVLTLVSILFLSLGSLVLVGFLSVRARDGFPRSPETSLTELVRTFGLGAIAVAFVLGMLRALGPGSFVATVLNVLALAAVLLLTDRLVPNGISVPRTTIAVPVVVVTVAHVFSMGGLFRGDLAGGLYTAALALGGTIAVAALAQTRRRAWTALPVLLAIHWWPTCLSPLVLVRGIC